MKKTGAGVCAEYCIIHKNKKYLRMKTVNLRK